MLVQRQISPSCCLSSSLLQHQWILTVVWRDVCRLHDIKQLREKAKEFIANPNDDPNMPEKHAKNIPFFGDVMITEKHVISVQNDVGTSYEAYLQVQNELVAAYNELRSELAKSKFGKEYAECSEEEKDAIMDYYPQKISEAEPKKYGGN